MNHATAQVMENQWNQRVEFKEPEPWSTLEFHGQGGEYFRIWIVNILLSVATLGIYSAWATVRNRRYFCGNTFLNGSHFDFHGDPRAILVGRLIAIVLLAGYVAGGYLHPAIPGVTMILIAALVPWLLVRSLCFRYRNTSYRNLRFDFVGGAGQAYGIFGSYFALALLVLALPAGLGWLLGQQTGVGAGLFLGLLLLYILIYPSFFHSLTQFKATHSCYGNTLFTPDLKREAYIGLFLGTVGVGVAAFIAFGVLLAIITVLLGVMVGATEAADLKSFYPVLVWIMIPAYFLPYAFWQVNTANYLFNNTHLESVQLRSNLSVWRYWGLLLSNAALVVITLGLAIPWARVRMARYRVESLAYRGDLQGFVGATVRDQGAAGEEIGNAFDIGLVGI